MPTDERILQHPMVQQLVAELSVKRNSVPIELHAPFVVVKAAQKGDRIIAGYASVAIVDKEGDLIPVPVLRRAFDKFMVVPQFRNAMVIHSNVQVGEILSDYIDSTGKKWTSHVDEAGLFVIAKIRDDIHLANEVWKLIEAGRLRAFSIGGEALERTLVQNNGNSYRRVDDLELHEITICERGVNPAAEFVILKRAQLSEYISRFPDLVLFKEFVNIVGSTAEKGEGNDVDLQVRLPKDDPLARHVITRLKKLFSDEEQKSIHVFAGDAVGPHDTFIPLYELCLMRAPLQRVEMTRSADAEEMKGMEEEKKKAEEGEVAKTADNVDARLKKLESMLEKLVADITELKEKAKKPEEYPYPPEKKEGDKDKEKYPYPPEEKKAADKDKKPEEKPEEKSKTEEKKPEEEKPREEEKKKAETPTGLSYIEIKQLSEKVEKLEKAFPVLKRSLVPFIGGPTEETKDLEVTDEELMKMDYKQVNDLAAKRREAVSGVTEI